MRLRNVSLILILHFWGLVAGAQTHYLDIEDDQIVSIFNAPGHNWKTCTKSNLCEPVAWPDNKATLRILGPAKKVKTLNPYTDKMVDEDYLPVEYEYKRNVNGKSIIKRAKVGSMQPMSQTSKEILSLPNPPLRLRSIATAHRAKQNLMNHPLNPLVE